MSVTKQLLALFRVDKEIRGLSSRLDGAERFLGEQTRQLADIATQVSSLEAQLRQLQASASNAEGESKRIDARTDELREKMNNSQTNKEYKALLSEVNNLKEQRGSFDEEAIGHLEKIEQIKTKLADFETAKGEREKVRSVAESERQERADEIASKLAELRSKRETLAEEVPGHAMTIYEELLAQRGDDAMAPLEIIDRKRHEFVCGSSMMSVPVEVAAQLMQGKLTISPNDGCILYLTEQAEESLVATFTKK
ncbi:MAG: zinc ribbon domain-containing protein [Phycisphaerales bacterium]